MAPPMTNAAVPSAMPIVVVRLLSASPRLIRFRPPIASATVATPKTMPANGTQQNATASIPTTSAAMPSSFLGWGCVVWMIVSSSPGF